MNNLKQKSSGYSNANVLHDNYITWIVSFTIFRHISRTWLLYAVLMSALISHACRYANCHTHFAVLYTMFFDQTSIFRHIFVTYLWQCAYFELLRYIYVAWNRSRCHSMYKHCNVTRCITSLHAKVIIFFAKQLQQRLQSRRKTTGGHMREKCTSTL